MKKIKNFQLCFYDNLGCYDETFYDSDGVDLFHIIECLKGYKNLDDTDEFQRLFVNFDDGTQWEIW